MRPKPKMTPQLKALLERITWRPGDVQILHRPGGPTAEYVVRDEDGNILEIQASDGTRVYVEPPAED